MAAAAEPVTVVIVTRDRAQELRRTLRNLAALAENPALVVVDNGSSDGSPAMVRTEFPTAVMIQLPGNRARVAARRLRAAASLEATVPVNSVTGYLTCADGEQPLGGIQLQEPGHRLLRVQQDQVSAPLA